MKLANDNRVVVSGLQFTALHSACEYPPATCPSLPEHLSYDAPFLGNDAAMTARTCMACGSDVGGDADRCDACGAEQETKLFHESSDVRLEPDRLGEELPSGELHLPAGRWGRASEHPKLDSLSSHLHERATPKPQAADAAGASDADSLEIPSTPPRVESPLPTTRMASPTPVAAGSGLAAAVSRAEEPEPRPMPAIEEVSLLTLVTPPVDTRTVTGSHPAIVRPPVLASEALQRDLTPAEPAPLLLRFWSPVLGLLGVAATWLLTRGHGVGAPLCGAFAALALLGIPRMPYAARAGAVATVAATGLVVVLWTDVGHAESGRMLVLTLTVNVLAAGLFFRAWHRASALARVMVALGILLGGSFLWMSEVFTQLTMVDTAWQSWAPRLVALPFGMLLMLSLLSFMNARTTAGATAWATFVLLWYALHATVKVLQSVWPKHAEEPDFTLVEPEILLAWGSAPIFSALLALSLAQLIASGIARATPQAPRHTHFEPIH